MKRRHLIAAAAIAPLSGRLAAQEASALPPGACDTHVHVLDPARFPFRADRRYTPGPATVGALEAMHARIGVARVVVVQNSVYGSDHRCLLDALAQLGPARARGVGAISAATTDDQVADLDRAGVRGTRLNLEVGKDRDAAAAERTLRQAAVRMPPGWHVHINAALPVIAGLADAIAALPAPVVLDHFAHIEAAGGPDQPGAEAVYRLLRSGKAYVKLSGPYQISTRLDYGDIAPVARALVAAAPERIMWGSDWPHTGGAGRPADQPVDFVEPFRAEDDAANLALLTGWVPDPAMRRRILVDTPAALYGFPTAPS